MLQLRLSSSGRSTPFHHCRVRRPAFITLLLSLLLLLRLSLLSLLLLALVLHLLMLQLLLVAAVTVASAPRCGGR